MEPIEFFFKYWAQIVIPSLVVIFTAVLFHYSSDDTKTKLKKFHLIPISILFCVWFIVRKMWIHTLENWKTPDIIFLILIVLIPSSILFMYREKYLTPGFVIAHGCKGCVATTPLKIGKYVAFNIGSSNHSFTSREGDLTLVVPLKLITPAGPFYFCNVEVTRRNFDKLPTYVKNQLKKLGDEYNLNNVWYGVLDPETALYGKAIFKDFEGQKITPAELQEELMNAYQVANTNQSFLDKDTRAVEDFNAFLERVGRKQNNKINISETKKEEDGP